MRIITWNVCRAIKSSQVWNILLNLQPDIALLQEVGEIPESIKEIYQIKSERPVTQKNNLQKFLTVILIKGEIIENIHLFSKKDWINKKLDFFKGNFIGCVAKIEGYPQINVICVYSPAWNISKEQLIGIDISTVALKDKTKLSGAEILCDALKEVVDNKNIWVVGGDYNWSDTFEKDYPGGPQGIVSCGSKELRDRMYSLGFKECLKEFNNSLVPTFKNHYGNRIIHQIDHLYVTENLFNNLSKCVVGDNLIFEKKLSDHLPIIADFKYVQ